MKVAILESLGISLEKVETLEAPLKEKGVEFVSYEKTSDEDVLVDELKDVDVAILANMPLSSKVIEKCSQLKYIDIAFTGVDHVGVAKAKEMGMQVSNASGYSTEAVAELAIGGVLSMYRYLRETEQACRNHQAKGSMIGLEIKGKTVGIIGLGKIGNRTAELFHCFGASIIASKKHPSEVEPWITLMSTEEVLKNADIVILNCPLNDETRGMINLEQLKKMKKNAILVNLARGPVVNEKDLCTALEEKVIAGAVIDVFEKEPPLEDTPILHAPNTLLTPHIGFATKEAMDIRADIVFENLTSWLDGKHINQI